MVTPEVGKRSVYPDGHVVQYHKPQIARRKLASVRARQVIQNLLFSTDNNARASLYFGLSSSCTEKKAGRCGRHFLLRHLFEADTFFFTSFTYVLLVSVMNPT